MREMEEMLKDSGEAVRNMAVPDEMEVRLKGALQKKRKRRKPYGRVAAAVIALIFVTYNFNAIAYYARQFMGFDHIMDATLKDLNELGRGQVIDRSYTFSDGTELILEGIMVDENRLVAFITEHLPEARAYHCARPHKVKGFLGRCNQNSGVSEFSEDGKTVKSIYYFDPPGPLAKRLTMELLFLKDGYSEEGKIAFELDRNKAMGYSIKEKIGRTITLEDNSTVRLKSITVSPMMTSIDGTMKLKGGHAMPDSGPSPFAGPRMDLKLFADNEEVKWLGGSIGGSKGEYKFAMEFDTLFAHVSTIEIVLSGLAYHKEMRETVELFPGEQNLALDLEGNKIILKNLDLSGSSAVLTVLTGGKSPLIESASLGAGGAKVPLVGIDGGSLYSDPEGDEEGLVEWQLFFEGLPQSDRYVLEIERIHYLKPCHESVVMAVQ